MSDDEVSLGDGSLDLDVQLRELPPVPVHEPDERIGAVGRLRVVLDVAVAEVRRHGLLRFALVESELVAGADRVGVRLRITHRGCLLTVERDVASNPARG